MTARARVKYTAELLSYLVRQIFEIEESHDINPLGTLT
jgi:hypothetical protein